MGIPTINGSLYGYDTMVRANQSGLGTATDGTTYTQYASSGTPTTSISNNEAVIVSAGVDCDEQLGTATGSYMEVLCRIAISVSGDICGVEAFYTNNAGSISNYKLLYYSGGIHLNKAVNSTNTSLNSYTMTLTPGTFYWFRLRCTNANQQYGRVWQDGTTEPSTWQVSATDTSLTSGGYALLANTGSSSTGVQFDHFYASNPSVAVGTITDTTSAADQLSVTDMVTLSSASTQSSQLSASVADLVSSTQSNIDQAVAISVSSQTESGAAESSSMALVTGVNISNATDDIGITQASLAVARTEYNAPTDQLASVLLTNSTDSTANLSAATTIESAQLADETMVSGQLTFQSANLLGDSAANLSVATTLQSVSTSESTPTGEQLALLTAATLLDTTANLSGVSGSTGSDISSGSIADTTDNGSQLCAVIAASQVDSTAEQTMQNVLLSVLLSSSTTQTEQMAVLLCNDQTDAVPEQTSMTALSVSNQLNITPEQTAQSAQQSVAISSSTTQTEQMAVLLCNDQTDSTTNQSSMNIAQALALVESSQQSDMLQLVLAMSVQDTTPEQTTQTSVSMTALLLCGETNTTQLSYALIACGITITTTDSMTALLSMLSVQISDQAMRPVTTLTSLLIATLFNSTPENEQVADTESISPTLSYSTITLVGTTGTITLVGTTGTITLVGTTGTITLEAI